jgi:glycosyltransferase involved in cell wall biosynthesis
MIRTLIEGSIHDAEHWVSCPEPGAYFEIFQRLLGASRVFSAVSRARAINPDIIHTHGFGAGLMGRLATIGSGIPVVHTLHGFYPRGAGIAGGVARLAIELMLSPATRAAVAVSDSEKRLVRRLCPLLARRTVVIPNGVRPKHLAMTPAAAPLVVRVLVVGRLVIQKFPQLSARIAAACRRLDPTLEFEFRLAGTGPLGLRTLEEARRLGVDGHLRLLGDVADISPELASAHVYLSTARWEGLSLALLEAMHAGLPCVASRVQGNIDAIQDGHSGLLYDLNCPEQAAQHIVNLARDPIARRSFGQQAQTLAKARFSVASMCRQYLDLYQRVLDPMPAAVSPALEHTRP